MRDIWLKATVIGSLWAAIEIVVGSFLHNLRVPLAGSMLAFTSVILLVAFLRIWPMKGLVIRAALISALMKSISPSAVIIGPMTGIMLEGVLIEAAILILGVNRLSFIIGGMLAVWSALLHKIVTLVILYGGDLVRIVDSLYQFAVKQIGLTGSTLWEPLALLSALYFFTGALAALIGMRLRISEKGTGRLQNLTESRSHNLFNWTDHGSYSVAMLLVIVAGLITVLGLMNLSSVQIFLPAAGLFIAFLSVRYKRALRPLTRPKFWIQLVLITFLAAIVIEGVESGKWFSANGLMAGLLINLRAITILMSFAAIGTELKNPLIRAILYRRGFANLYESLQMAFSVLPALMAKLPERVRNLRDIPRLASQFLALSRDLYEVYSSMYRQRPNVFLVTGARQTGKSQFLRQLNGLLEEMGIHPAGFMACVVKEGDDVKGYDLVIPGNGETVPFCRTEGPDYWDRVGRFYIHPDGIAAGYALFKEAETHSPRVFFVDEVGPLEMNDQGWADGLRILAAHPEIIQVWTVRDKLARKVTRKWPERNFTQVSIQKENPEWLAKKINHLVHQTAGKKPD